MWYWLLLGFTVGVFVGVAYAAWVSVQHDKNAILCGVIKLCGKLYVLKELDL